MSSGTEVAVSFLYQRLQIDPCCEEILCFPQQPQGQLRKGKASGENLDSFTFPLSFGCAGQLANI